MYWYDGGRVIGVSTSGPPFKAPGRVGDSPLPGCGLYADNTVSTKAILSHKLLLTFQVVE